MKKIGFFGIGVWGYCLASLLATKGYHVVAWGRDKQKIAYLQQHREHFMFKGIPAPDSLEFTTEMSYVFDSDCIVESVTSSGIRELAECMKKLNWSPVPFVLTSKGIEQSSGLLLSEVVLDVLGESFKPFIGCLSGPSIAQEVMQGLPCSLVCTAYDASLLPKIHDLFLSHQFRVYPNSDIKGVEIGGALKNIIAIACGVSDGLGFGDNAKAALMTRGLHEIRKLAVLKGANPETLNGLAGMGDLFVTCLSTFSRNYRFGKMIAQGASPDQAKEQIGMVVEGMYSCLSALQLAKEGDLEVPITKAVYAVVYKQTDPRLAVKHLLERITKAENL